jgi:predicted 2-oxoglutarate/Fe(II)-dependent dioxygenase YbiX
MNMLDHILVIPNMLSNSECDSLVAEYDRRSNTASLERCLHAITGEPITSTFKRVELEQNTASYELMFERNEQVIIKWLKHLKSFNSYNIPMLSTLLRCSHTYRLMKYEVGGWIHPHTDWANFIHASCTFALSDDYEGGEFVFFNGKHSVKLNKGDAMIWPADCFWVHEVKPITKGSRYSVNSFICSLEFNKIFELSSLANQYMLNKRTYSTNKEII